ncbi:MAG: histidine phosphatase family protein [Pseudomonadota bacterium]
MNTAYLISMRALFATLLIAALMPLSAFAQMPSAAYEDGAVFLMTHALAPGTGDPDNFELSDCSTQRNLSAQGRRQAQAIGLMLSEADVGVDYVYTSQWCRCRETAELLNLEEVIDLPALNSFFRDRSRGAAQTEELKRFLTTIDQASRPVLVTHQVNITALTGVVPRSGETVIVRLVNGEIVVTGRIPPP